MSTPKSKTHKHVSRACLECRSRHLKCGGQEPVCERCRLHNRTCTYVKSHRGGSRKKGVSTKSKVKALNDDDSQLKADDNYDDEFQDELESNDVDMNLSRSTNSSSLSSALKTSDRNNHKSEILPCVKNGLHELADDPSCNEECLNIEKYNTLPPCLKSNHAHSSNDQHIGKRDVFHPIFNCSKDDEPLSVIFDDKYLKPYDQCYISPALIRNLNVESIINAFYNNFYTAHPFLPSKNDILQYLDAIPFKTDLLLVMKIMGDGQTTSKYARDIETVNYLVTSILSYIRQIGKDFISLQSLLLLSMIAHISSIHDLSGLIRDACISLALELKLNLIDQENVPSVFLDVNGFLTEREKNETDLKKTLLNTPSESDFKSNHLDTLFGSKRVQLIPRDILVETMRKTFWELYYYDSISGTASGHTKSRLATQNCLVLYPQSIPLTTFDFKSRAEACKLVNDAINLNIAIQSNSDNLPYLNHMRAALGNWEMRLANPDTYGAPYLINKDGTVNDGVFEAIMLLNYARIFTHRPFSYLWRSDVSKHPRCTDEKGIDDPCPPLTNKEVVTATDSRKIIETRKTIDSANYFMRTLLDTDPSQTCKRTPFLACALAFSCLVHLSAYSWVESNLSLLDSWDKGGTISSSELDIYTEYIKLEIGSTLQISKHWSLSAKLITHITETLTKVSTKLYKKVQAGILGLGFNIANGLNNNNISPNNQQNTVRSVTPATTSTIELSKSSENTTPLNLSNSNSKKFEQLNDYMNLENGQTSNSNNLTPLFEYQQTSGNSSNNLSSNNFNESRKTSASYTNNAFLSEFGELVNGLNLANHNEENFNGSVLGFPTESQDYGFLDPISPTSDTGCDWVDKHDFQFDPFPMSNANN